MRNVYKVSGVSKVAFMKAIEDDIKKMPKPAWRLSRPYSDEPRTCFVRMVTENTVELRAFTF